MKAEEYFKSVVQRKEIPEDISEFVVSPDMIVNGVDMTTAHGSSRTY